MQEQEVNPLIEQYEKARERMADTVRKTLHELNHQKDVPEIIACVNNALDDFLVNGGLVSTIVGLTNVCDAVSALKTSSIKDNALKRSVAIAARESGVRISHAKELASSITSVGAEAAFEKLLAEYHESQMDKETVSKLALQYEGIKVPLTLINKIKKLETAIEEALKKNPALEQVKTRFYEGHD